MTVREIEQEMENLERSCRQWEPYLREYKRRRIALLAENIQYTIDKAQNRIVYLKQLVKEKSNESK